MSETIFQHFVFQEFILPFLLIFLVAFAVLEKSKFLGEDKKKINAVVAFVIGLIFVTAVFPKTVISNLVLFLSVSLIVVFVVMLIWSFITGEDQQFKDSKFMKWALIIALAVGILFLLIWTIKVQTGFLDWISDREWSGPFWTNLLFAIVIAVALALVLSTSKKE